MGAAGRAIADDESAIALEGRACRPSQRICAEPRSQCDFPVGSVAISTTNPTSTVWWLQSTTQRLRDVRGWVVSGRQRS